MRKVTLIFPDTVSMADFIIAERVSKAETNTVDQTLLAPLSEDQIITACTQYGAELLRIVKLF